MQVESANSKLLSNHEVHMLVYELKNSSGTNFKKRGHSLKNLSTVVHTALSYLDQKTEVSRQTPESIQQFRAAVQCFGLTKVEFVIPSGKIIEAVLSPLSMATAILEPLTKL